jgi:Flp pilus assembly protein TadG
MNLLGSAKQQAQAALLTDRQFLADEDGTVTIFGLMMFIMMLGVGGIAVDVMRYETQRVQVQYTLDRAVLAAAAMNQTLDPEDVVIDYFAKAGLEGYRLDVDVDEGLNYRRVTADVEMDINMMFMNMFDIHAMTAPGFSSAEERIMNIEISMVLDVSGSMGWNNKMDNLHLAASEFINSVMAPNLDPAALDNTISMSIIPYNGKVNAGSTIESVFTLSAEHNNSSCTRFDEADFYTTVIDPAVEIERLAHFDYSYSNSYRDFTVAHCQTNDSASILPWSENPAELVSYVNSLSAGGWTAIDLGMKWGVGLLDPAARPALQALVAGNVVDGDFINRPVAYDDDETLKVIILMTDGENTEQWDLIQERKRGSSTVYFDNTSGRYSSYLPDYDLFYYPHSDGYGSTAWGADPQAIPWVDLWAQYTARKLAGEFYYYSGDWNYYNSLRYNSLELYSNTTSADRRLRSICAAAGAQGIVIFAIGFEAPQGGQDVMFDCATTEAHYYDVEGIEISEAFASIARSINQLRLIQ